MLDDQARGARVQETEGAIARLLEAGDIKRKGTGLGPPGIAAFTELLQALSERGSEVGASNAAEVANFKDVWDDLEPERAFDLVAHCNLAKIYDPALCRLELVNSVAEHREHIRGAIGQTGANRLLGQARDRTELKKVNFVAASRPVSPDRPLARSVDWRKFCVGQRINGSCSLLHVGTSAYPG